MSELKQTPNYPDHVAAGAKIVPFAGFEMPVSYSGIIEEHEAVRTAAGLFDVSHMGEFVVSGPDTWKFVNSIVTNNCDTLVDNGALYTVMCRDNGTVVDDLLVTRLGPEKALIVVNASNIDKDFDHMQKQLAGDVKLENDSEQYALLAVQGPASRDVLKACPSFAAAAEQIDEVGYYRCFSIHHGGSEIIISRTGYTGELGFEVFIPTGHARNIWNELLENGASHGLVPIGLAARDTLRFEAAFCLYGHELDDETTPLQAGLRWVVKLKKASFTGRDALIAEKKQGSTKRLAGFVLDGRNIARQGYEVLANGKVVGRVTSGTFSPTLKQSICMAYVDTTVSSDAEFAIQIRNKAVPMTQVDLPFYASRARA